MLTRGRRMSRIGDKDTFWILELEIAGQSYYFGDESRDITNTYGKPTVIHVHGCNLLDAFSKSFDVGADLTGDVSVSFTDLRIPLELKDLFRWGERLAGNRALLSLLRVGTDYGQKWPQVAGIIENPTAMSADAPTNCVSFAVNQETGKSFQFPDDDYLIGAGWIATVDLGQTPAELFGWDNDDILSDDDGDHADDDGELTPDWLTFYLFGTTTITLEMPEDYGDSPAYAPFVFGKPGIESLTALSKDLNADGSLDSGTPDERALGYYTTPGQTIAVRALEKIDDDGIKLQDVIEEYDSGLNVVDVDYGYAFPFLESGLVARVLVHAGKAAQVGSSIHVVDRSQFGTPYDTSGDYLVKLAYTARGRPYSYIDVPADYSDYLDVLDPVSRTHDTASGVGVYIVLDGDDSEFHIFGIEISGTVSDVPGVSEINETVAKALWDAFYCCWISVLRTGGNIGDAITAFFTIPIHQQIIEGADSSERTYQDFQLSCFNKAMDPARPFVIRYPNVVDLSNYGVTNWTVGGQSFMDGCTENPAELLMFMAECSGLALDRGSFFTLRYAMRGWKLAGCIDDATDVLSYATGVLQEYLPFTLGRTAEGISAIYWDCMATRNDACHHFVEGVDLEIVGDGIVEEEEGLIRSLRLSGRKITWLSQSRSPFGTTTVVQDTQITAKELSKLDRFRHRANHTSAFGVTGVAGGRRLAKFQRELRSRYGTWDFSQSFDITEQADQFWRTNNYTGDIVSATQGRWVENPLTFPSESKTAEQWSRFMPDPTLIAAFSRNKELDAQDLVLELEEVCDLTTLNRSADWLLADRANPRQSFEGISGKALGWIIEGDVVRVTSPTLGLVDEVCWIRLKTWQTTNVAWTFRPIRRAIPALHPSPNAEVSTPAAELIGDPEFLLLLHLDTFINIDIADAALDSGEFAFEVIAHPIGVLSGDPVFGADSASLLGDGDSSERYLELSTSSGVGTTYWDILGTSPDLTIDLYESWSGAFPTGGTQKRLFGSRSTDTHSFFITLIAGGFIHVESEGTATLDLTSNTPLVAGQKTLIRFSTHDGVASLWIGVVGDATMTCVDVGPDTTTWSNSSTGHVVQIHGDFGGSNPGTGLVDEVAVMKDTYMSDMTVGALGTMPVAAWIGPGD